MASVAHPAKKQPNAKDVAEYFSLSLNSNKRKAAKKNINIEKNNNSTKMTLLILNCMIQYQE
jgi:hypothetical protein